MRSLGQGIGEGVFDIAYLLFTNLLGWVMIIGGISAYSRLSGIMALVLSFGDAFHLIPRIIALTTTGTDDYAFSLGLGKLITSITMTFFYVLLYVVQMVNIFCLLYLFRFIGKFITKY
jgi:hypothetical protein